MRNKNKAHSSCKSAAAIIHAYGEGLFSFYVSGFVLYHLIYSYALFNLFIVSSPLCSFSHLPSVYCVTSPCKDDTPPGYQQLSLGDMQAREGGTLGPVYLKPPNYSMALQRSKLLGNTRRMAAEHHANFTRPASVALHAVAKSREGMFSKPPDIINDTQQTVC